MSDPTMFPPARTLSELIRYLTDDFDGIAGRELQDAIAKMEQLATDGLKESKATVTLTLSIKRDNSGMYDVLPELKLKTPRMPSTRTVLWADRNHNFTVVNPRQIDMGFRQVDNRRRDASDA